MCERHLRRRRIPGLWACWNRCSRRPPGHRPLPPRRLRPRRLRPRLLLPPRPLLRPARSRRPWSSRPPRRRPRHRPGLNRRQGLKSVPRPRPRSVPSPRPRHRFMPSLRLCPRSGLSPPRRSPGLNRRSPGLSRLRLRPGLSHRGRSHPGRTSLPLPSHRPPQPRQLGPYPPSPALPGRCWLPRIASITTG